LKFYSKIKRLFKISSNQVRKTHTHILEIVCCVAAESKQIKSEPQ
jgi:hypothetical protein